MPPVLDNHGKYVASLNRLTKWLGEKAEAAGADVFPAFPGQELLWDGDRGRSACGSATRAIGADGSPKSNYEPGPDLHGEGRRARRRPARHAGQDRDRASLGLDRDRDPQVYAVGDQGAVAGPGRAASPPGP